MEENKNSKHKLIVILGILIILITSVILYSRYVATKGLQIIEDSVVDKDLPTSFNGFKIVQFADIHYGKTTNLEDVKNVVNNINKLNPDIVIFTGDLFDKNIKVNEKEITKLKDEFAKIDASINKYAVKGDNDYKQITDFETIFKYANFTILDNSNEMIYYKDTTPIKIVGTTSLLKSKIDYVSAFNTFGDENKYFTILISHEPNIIEHVKDYDINLLFAANSLGGLINIPFVGGVIKFDGSNNYTKGYYKVDNTQMYVNSGIGTQKYNFRLFNRPSINLYRLYNY